MRVGRIKSLGASGVVLSRPGWFLSCVLTAGAEDATVTLFDHASAASGKKVCELAAKAGESVAFNTQADVRLTNGLFAQLTGTGAVVSVVFIC